MPSKDFSPTRCSSTPVRAAHQPDSHSSSRVKRDRFDFEVPEELYAADTRVLGKVRSTHQTLELIFEGLSPDHQVALLGRLPGRNAVEQTETFAQLVRGEKIGFCAPLEQFNLLLQKGHFSELYQREREVERITNSFHYKQASLQNHKHYLARGAAKAFEARLQKSEQSLFASVGRPGLNRHARRRQARG